MTRKRTVFVDSNVVFSAAHKLPNQFVAMWSIEDVEILTSEYVIGEVNRNLKKPESRGRLWRLIENTRLVTHGSSVKLPPNIQLPAKDEPILRAAIEAQADILVTGDLSHFGSLMGTAIDGVLIESPVMFRRRYPNFFPPPLGAA